MRTVEILDAGPLTTVQDAGRPGYAHLGVPRSGALDGPAYELANRLVGNGAGQAVLEVTVGGLRLRAGQAMSVAVTGAPGAVSVGGRGGAWGQPLAVAAGEELAVGRPSWGVRSYLAVGGGFAVEPVLGSCSTDVLSGLGPPTVRAGDVLAVGDPTGAVAAVDVALFERLPDPVGLRVLAGPRDDWFSAEALDALATAEFAVAAESNRIAVRLAGPPLTASRREELPSEGIVLGAVQVPPDGQPLIFLNDHPTTGGYPVIGVVCAADLPACAQLAAGDAVRFAWR